MQSLFRGHAWKKGYFVQRVVPMETGVQTLLPAEVVFEQWQRRECRVVQLEFAAGGLAVYLLARWLLGALNKFEEDSVFETAGVMGKIDVFGKQRVD